jgi:hypothetical protein
MNSFLGIGYAAGGGRKRPFAVTFAETISYTAILAVILRNVNLDVFADVDFFRPQAGFALCIIRRIALFVTLISRRISPGRHPL